MIERRIVVGVDGSAGSLGALRVALEEARLHQVQLHVVLAWQLTLPEIALETPTLLNKVEARAAQTLEQALTSIDHGRAAGVVVSSELMNSPAAPALLATARDAMLLVVGTRGIGGLTGTLVGSVAHAAIHHAPCPVLVVPQPTSDMKDT